MSAVVLFAKTDGTRRVYVQPFTTRSGSERLRNDVIAELRKNKSISLLKDSASAQSILYGGGEIWVKGYKSLNPRSGRLPSDGAPVYDGYLAVELQDKNGATYWSDLVSPAAETASVSRDLAKHIAKDVEAALVAGEPPSATAPLPQPSTVLTGAGATFPEPVYSKWFLNYRRDNPAVEIQYEPVGSDAGIRKLLGGGCDFGASDSPEAIRNLAPDRQANYLFLPSVVGAVVPIVNLPGVTSEISFTPEALAGIYLGTIKKWNDPVLKRANKGVHLPDLEIVVVHRADGSGTSYAFSDYLSKTDSDWKAKVGVSMKPAWPVGREAAGNDGVAKMVKELGGSIGYVEFIYALQNHLSYGRVRNQQGNFVAASLESMSAAVDKAPTTDVVNAPGALAYPIASFTWLVVPTRFSDAAKRDSMRGFLRWMLGPGQLQAAALGYLALPPDVVQQELAQLKSF